MVATTDPKELAEKATWYLATNLPHPDYFERRKEESKLAAADLAEIVRLYGLRMWVEQSYKQVKHVLGWSDYQLRSELAIRRHWQLVCCAFSLCWWAHGRLPTDGAEPAQRTEGDLPTQPEGESTEETSGVFLAPGIESGKSVAGALGNAHAILEGLQRSSPPTQLKALLERVFSGRGLYLYVH